jgi:hypothetical protein
LRFTATERFAVDRIAFAWRARFKAAGPLSITVDDGYAAGEGRLEARLLGVPVQRQSGGAVTKGEVLRYLAELAWAPYAMESNRELEWRELDRRSVEVAACVGDEVLTVKLEFEGVDVVRASSRMRSYRKGREWVQTPWAGEFSRYEILGGMRLPSEAEVYWDLPERRFVYWRGHVTAAEVLEEAFPR